VTAGAQHPFRRRAVIVIMCVGVVIIIGGGFVWVGSQGLSGGASTLHPAGPAQAAPDSSLPAPSSSSSLPGIPPDPDQATVTPVPAPDPVFGEVVLDTVSLEATADLGGSVTARITDIVPGTAVGSGLGEVSGPSVRVSVELTNGTSEPVTLDEVTVNAYFGQETLPASPILANTDSSGFSGALAAGARALASYSFSVPADQQASVTVTVSKSAGDSIVVFG